MNAIYLGALCGFLSLFAICGCGNSNTVYYSLQNGKHVYFRPVNFPQNPSQNANAPVPLLSRVNTEPNRHLQMASTQISHGSEIFSFEMFGVIADAVRDYDANFVISPFSVWSLMLLVAEGASNCSYDQMEKVLRIPNNLQYLRTAYKNVQRLLLVNTSTIELAVNQAVFSDLNRPLEPTYVNTLVHEYEADHLPVNFREPNSAVKTINDHISRRTRGKILDVLKPEDLAEAQLLLTSAIFFRGQWKFPFNVSQTRDLPFYQENGAFIANVPMMYQRNVFSFAPIDSIGATIIELPYGKEDRLCMLLIYPRRNTTLTAVFDNLGQINIARINEELHRFDNTEDYEETEIELTLPKFNIDSDLELRTVFEYLGIKDIFDPAKANLSKMSKEATYISRVFHKAVIEVNEQGTVAASVTGGTLSFKQSPLEFTFNRPFGFMITDRVTNTLLFAGQVRHPLV